MAASSEGSEHFKALTKCQSRVAPHVPGALEIASRRRLSETTRETKGKTKHTKKEEVYVGFPR